MKIKLIYPEQEAEFIRHARTETLKSIGEEPCAALIEPSPFALYFIAYDETEEGDRAQGPQLLPGGEWLLLTLLSGSSTWNDASIVAQSLSGGERKLLVAGGTDGRYVPTGHIVYFLEGDLVAVPFNVDSVEVTGGAVSVVEGVQAVYATGASQYAFSDRGELVYMPGGIARSAFQLAWVNRNGQVERLPFEPRSSGDFDLSPDGQRIALEILGDDGEWDIWIYEVERGGSQVLLTREGNNRTPVWSHDGEWVFFWSDRRSGTFDIWKRRADRSLDAVLVEGHAGSGVIHYGDDAQISDSLFRDNAEYGVALGCSMSGGCSHFQSRRPGTSVISSKAMLTDLLV